MNTTDATQTQIDQIMEEIPGYESAIIEILNLRKKVEELENEIEVYWQHQAGESI